MSLYLRILDLAPLIVPVIVYVLNPAVLMMNYGKYTKYHRD